MIEENVGQADFGPGFASGVEGDAAAHEGVADEVIAAFVRDVAGVTPLFDYVQQTRLPPIGRRPPWA